MYDVIVIYHFAREQHYIVTCKNLSDAINIMAMVTRDFDRVIGIAIARMRVKTEIRQTIPVQGHHAEVLMVESEVA